MILFKLERGYCLFGFYGVSTVVSYLMPNLFSYTKQFYFKQFNLALVHNLIVKQFLFQAMRFSQTVPFQTILFSMSMQLKCQNS